MSFPPYATRATDFTRDANNGLASPDPSGVDTELNALQHILNLINVRIRGITNVDGTLKNLATATAQALAGTQDVTATVDNQTVFVTTIPWVASFTTDNVFVFKSGLKTAVSAVADNGSGFLQVTIAAQPNGTTITIAAFESGAGILTRLQTPGTAGEGANLVSIEDIGGLIAAVTVEGALQEIVGTLNTLITNVGNTADLIRRTGTVDFIADQSMGGFKITDLADGTDPTDAVTVQQLDAYTAALNALQSYFLRLDGSTTMAGALNMGANKVVGVTDGTDPQDAVTVTQLGTKLSLDGSTPMTAALPMGGFRITGLGTPTAEDDACTLAAARTVAASFSTRSQYAAAGTYPFVVPAGVIKLRTRAWGGGAGGGAANAATRYGGGGGAYAEATLTVTPGETLTVIVGAGGAAGISGGNTIIQRGATVLIQANGGVHGNSTGLGGSYTFDGSVVGFGINGGDGRVYWANIVATEPTGQPGGHGGAAPMGGQGGQAPTIAAGTTNGNLTAGGAPGGGGGGYPLSAAAGAAGRVELEY